MEFPWLFLFEKKEAKKNEKKGEAIEEKKNKQKGKTNRRKVLALLGL